jgi:hypothetical protein
VVSVFERLNKGRPPPAETASKQSRSSPPLLLDWLRNRWPGTTVCARDIYRCAPTPIRGDRKIALNLAEALALQGYLAPIPTHRYDRKAWQIVGKTGENARLSQ